MISINTGSSDAIEELRVNPITGAAEVKFWASWPTYRLEGISRRSLLKGILKNAVGRMPSKGEWVNSTILEEGRWVRCVF